MLFVAAAHFVYGTFLGGLWAITRVFVRAAGGRQRFHVPGGWDAVTRRRLTVTSTTVVNTDTRCQLLRAIPADGFVGPVTVVLDDARDQRDEVAQGLAVELGIRLLFPPSYCPNRDLIARLGGFTKRRSVDGQ